MSAKLMQSSDAIPAAPQPNNLLVMSPSDIIARVKHIQQIKNAVMKEDVHYGKAFGESGKNSLLKPGAEILCVTFGLAPRFIEHDLSTEDEFRVSYTCEVYTIGANTYIASGVGEASSNELKYKWRAAVCDEEFEATAENKRRIHYKKKRDGDFEMIKQIKTDAADIRNTVRKMAKKRAYVDAALTATGASDMFDQDIEDLQENGIEVVSTRRTGEPVFFVKAIASKPTSTGGTKYTITMTDNKSYNTFNNKFADLAESGKARKLPLLMKTREGKYGVDIVDLKEAPPPMSDHPPKEEVHEDKKPEVAQAPARTDHARPTTPIASEIATKNKGILDSFWKNFKVKPAQLEAAVGQAVIDWTDQDREFLYEIEAKLVMKTSTVEQEFGI